MTVERVYINTVVSQSTTEVVWRVAWDWLCPPLVHGRKDWSAWRARLVCQGAATSTQKGSAKAPNSHFFVLACAILGNSELVQAPYVAVLGQHPATVGGLPL